MLNFDNVIKDKIEENQYILVIAKYDQILGPRSLYSSSPLEIEEFIRTLLRDALNTKTKHLKLDYDSCYCQVNKIEIDDLSARGNKQLYALILLIDKAFPPFSILQLQSLELLLRSLGNETILSDNSASFHQFYLSFKNILLNKELMSPLESCSLKIRTGINAIIGFCDLIIEEHKQNQFSMKNCLEYIKLIRESGEDILFAIEDHFGSY